MQILFLHNNFPAQFGTLGQYLAQQGDDVWFGTQRKNSSLPGIKSFFYEPHREPNKQTHPYALNFEKAVLNGQAVARAALKHKNNGLDPDIVVAHSGWGPGLYAKDIWPKAKYVGYFEWYYHPDSPDVQYFDAEKRSLDDELRSRGRNAAILTDLASCDAGLCPTKFQHDQFPEALRSKLNVIHDGVDTNTYRRDSSATITIGENTFSAEDEIVTYVARGMEPYRGFPQFMKTVELIQKRRKNTKFLIVGEDRVAYGKQLKADDSFKKRALNDLDLDLSRTIFTGLLPRSEYLKVLQVSSIHMYLTIPFVLSWSMMEAMSAECTLVASSHAPVRELIDHNKHGALVNMDEPEEMADVVCNLLDDRERRRAYGRAACERICAHYDFLSLSAKRKSLFEALVNNQSITL